MFPEGQQGCRKRTRGTREQLPIDQHISKESKTWRENVYGADWYKNLYDMVLQSWIIDCLKMYQISGEVIKFIENTIENLWEDLTARRKTYHSRDEIERPDLELVNKNKKWELYRPGGTQREIGKKIEKWIIKELKETLA